MPDINFRDVPGLEKLEFMKNSINVFRDPQSDDAAILQALSGIGSGDAGADLWTGVANNPIYRPFHRAAAVRELFKRQINCPITLKQIAFLLEGGLWLKEAVIEKIEHLGGEIPVKIPAGGSAFIIRLYGTLHPAMGIYLAIDQDISTFLLKETLMLRTTDPLLREYCVVDLAVFPQKLTLPQTP